MDKNGCINNDHDIHIRAQRAAERVALKRGWTCSTMNLTTGRQPTADLTDMAVALFVGMLDVPAVPSEGGGSSSDLPWGREDEDDRA